ncbi:MAG: hypothetical protein ACK41E_00820 [Deinococcales bacterium]
MTDCTCPTCGAARYFVRNQSGLERRRYPKGRWVCDAESQPWHLQLESLLRELATCKNELVRAALVCEIARLQSKSKTAVLHPLALLSRSA